MDLGPVSGVTDRQKDDSQCLTGSGIIGSGLTDNGVIHNRVIDN